MSKISELMKSVSAFIERFSSISKTIDHVVNSSNTPEEFLINKSTPPSIQYVRDFLAKYDLRQIIKAQMFNSKNNLFIHNGCIGFVLKVDYCEVSKGLLSTLLDNQFPKESTLSFLLSKVDGATKVFLTLSSKSSYNQRVAAIHQQKVVKVYHKIIELFEKSNIAIEVVKPIYLRVIIDEILTSTTDHSYDGNSYIYQQLAACKDNEIDDVGVLKIGNISRRVFYTKQYPSISKTLLSNPIIEFLEQLDSNQVGFYYCLNINLDFNQYRQSKIYEFTTTIVLQDCNEQIAEEIALELRNQFTWFIYPNLLFPFQQFMEIIPFQYDHESAARQSKYSTTQKLPTKKLTELVPLEYHNEN